MSYRLEQSTDEDFYNDKNHPEGTRKPLAFDVKDEGCQAHKDLEEPLKKARMTMKSSEPEATPQTGRGCLVTWPPEDNQQVYTEEQRYRQGFLDGFRAGQETGLKLAKEITRLTGELAEWISVEKQVPPDEGPWLVFHWPRVLRECPDADRDTEADQWVAYYVSDQPNRAPFWEVDILTGHATLPLKDVTHWRPLPKPPSVLGHDSRFTEKDWSTKLT
jgi:hypothetical protein